MATEVTYNGDGSNKTFSITFPFIKSDDVKVQVGGSTLSASDYSITGTVVTTDTAPASGTGNVKLYRVTPIDYAVHDFSAGSTIRAKNLNDNQKQVLYGIEEAKLVTVTSGGITTGAKNDIHVNSDSDWIIRTDAVEQSMLADNSVGTDQYIDNSIEHIHLKNDVIDGDNIQDDVINSEHYAAASIDHEHLSNDCIDGDNIQDDVINSEHIAAGAVDLEHMASESVDEDNLKISNAGSNGQFLQKQSGNTGGLTWASQAASAGSQIGWKHMSTNTAVEVSSNDTWTDTGLELTYTPSSSNSLIFLDARQLMFLRSTGHSTNQARFRFELDDSGNDLGEKFHITGGSSWSGSYGYNVGIIHWPVSFTYVYTNSNTTQKVFKLQAWKDANTYLDLNPDTWFTSSGKSWFILSEIQQ